MSNATSCGSILVTYLYFLLPYCLLEFHILMDSIQYYIVLPPYADIKSLVYSYHAKAFYLQCILIKRFTCLIAIRTFVVAGNRNIMSISYPASISYIFQ